MLENGHTVSDRGRIPKSVVEAWAHEGRPRLRAVGVGPAASARACWIVQALRSGCAVTPRTCRERSRTSSANRTCSAPIEPARQAGRRAEGDVDGHGTSRCQRGRWPLADLFRRRPCGSTVPLRRLRNYHDARRHHRRPVGRAGSRRGSPLGPLTAARPGLPRSRRRVRSAAVYRACAGECPSAEVDRCNAMDRRRYINGRHVMARRMQRRMATITRGRPLANRGRPPPRIEEASFRPART